MILAEDPEEDEKINKAIIISCAINLFFCTVVIFSYIILRNLITKPVLRYIGYLTIANYILSLSRLIGALSINDEKLCEIVAIFIYYGFYSTFFWVSIFSFRIYRTLAFRNGTNFARHEKCDLWFGFAFTIILPLFIYFKGWFGVYKNSECSISDNYGDLTNEMYPYLISIFIPEGMTFLAILITNFLIIKIAKSSFTPENAK